jgi:uncharacterized protein (TIGR02611 family)
MSNMNRLGRGLRKLVVAMIGFPLLIVGLVLIPLPGPGVLVCLVALFVLASEFDWAHKYYELAKTKLNNIIADIRAKQRKD